MKNSADSSHIRSFVLRSGRMSNRQKYAYEHLRDRYSIPYTGEPTDVTARFRRPGEIIVEIGFGAGEALLTMAERRREINFLGIEVYKAGIGRVVSEIHEKELDNLLIIAADAYLVVTRMLPPETLSGIHLFFPDPWPKKRHHKRRLIQPEFSNSAAGALKPCGYLYTVTDWPDYAEHALRVLSDTPGLTNRFEGYAPAQEWRPHTRFEEKGRAKNHRIYELLFEKNGFYSEKR